MTDSDSHPDIDELTRKQQLSLYMPAITSTLFLASAFAVWELYRSTYLLFVIALAASALGAINGLHRVHEYQHGFTIDNTTSRKTTLLTTILITALFGIAWWNQLNPLITGIAALISLGLLGLYFID